MRILKYIPENKIDIPISEILRYAGMPGCKDPGIYKRACEIALQCSNAVNAGCVYQRYRIEKREERFVQL